MVRVLLVRALARPAPSGCRQNMGLVGDFVRRKRRVFCCCDVPCLFFGVERDREREGERGCGTFKRTRSLLSLPGSLVVFPMDVPFPRHQHHSHIKAYQRP
jgi:hypothetical protein